VKLEVLTAVSRRGGWDQAGTQGVGIYNSDNYSSQLDSSEKKKAYNVIITLLI